MGVQRQEIERTPLSKNAVVSKVNSDILHSAYNAVLTARQHEKDIADARFKRRQLESQRRYPWVGEGTGNVYKTRPAGGRPVRPSVFQPLLPEVAAFRDRQRIAYIEALRKQHFGRDVNTLTGTLY